MFLLSLSPSFSIYINLYPKPIYFFLSKYIFRRPTMPGLSITASTARSSTPTSVSSSPSQQDVSGIRSHMYIDNTCIKWIHLWNFLASSCHLMCLSFFFSLPINLSFGSICLSLFLSPLPSLSLLLSWQNIWNYLIMSSFLNLHLTLVANFRNGSPILSRYPPAK